MQELTTVVVYLRLFLINLQTMKTSILSTTTFGLAAMGLALSPVLAIEASPAAASEEVAASNTATVYIVKVSGKG